VTLQAIEAGLRRRLDKLEATVVQALARAVVRFVQADEAANCSGLAAPDSYFLRGSSAGLM
jgi:hypothetical protein